jgi:transposase
MPLSFSGNSRKRAIAEGTLPCEISWLVCARDSLAWHAHQNRPKMESLPRCSHQENCVGCSQSEKKSSHWRSKVISDGFWRVRRQVKLVYHLLQAFLSMLHQRRPERLDGWMKEARACGIKELGSFVTGLERDYDAVRAALTHPWSQGPVEGTVHKIKTHKRLMYGRACFTLLRQKLLHLT